MVEKSRPSAECGVAEKNRPGVDRVERGWARVAETNLQPEPAVS